MTIKAVLTGDLVHSQAARDVLAYVDGLHEVLRKLEGRFAFQAETYRGDGFQLVPGDASEAMRCAVLLRAGLIAASPATERWDARIAVGLGQVDARGGFGEAFVLSGRGLDGMKKSRLALFSRDERLLERLELATEFVAAIIDGWTAVEAQTYFLQTLAGLDQQGTADLLGKSRVTVNKALQRANARLVERYLECSRKWIEELLRHG
ncbi:hypothetical protein [Metapseudomonas furukawaii]|uniref:SatD family (SatD) n=1 Tax=Metapseudomonas furukawaii TaxID=1149133 RepID=A0AAD1FHW2_METFU|nr:hypothetical protein [Pseudomonas furukawaii]ELS26057.1 hypothetical protein ppKF707_2293 [Pseudomonas furukawaii]WAG78481.1 hypothetical protein LMK08_24515 [Pseudomonas furukawaii]BAU76769.1 hypothetical protein KF707C_50810 [Pseudomonas furukawaii]